MIEEKHLGRELKGLSHILDRRMTKTLDENGAQDITPMHGRILGYLHFHGDRELCQRDIEAEFRITRSTVTSILKLMEKKGFIRREEVARDARLKRLYLTELGEEHVKRIHLSINQTEQLMRQALSDEEWDIVMRSLEKLQKVL